RQLTFSPKSETSPRWSPDGRTLAFLSDRDERKQVYLMSMDGGEAKAFTTGKRAVSSFAWSPDGKTIAFLAPDTATDAQSKKEKHKAEARVVARDDRQARLWVQPVAGGDAKPLTPALVEVNELAWGAPGDRIVVSLTDRPASDSNTNRIA